MARLVAMQPYFLPYLGYFSLLVRSEVFVVLDEDQYVPRRWMNRTKISLDPRDEWLTLPISGQSGTRIPLSQCVVAKDTDAYIKAERKYSELVSSSEFHNLPPLNGMGENLVQINMQTIKSSFEILKLRMPAVAYWSDLKNLVLFEGGYQNRAIALAKYFDCETYVNPSGGRLLYEHAMFAHSGLKLEFMHPFVKSDIDKLSLAAQTDSIASIAERIGTGAQSSE